MSETQGGPPLECRVFVRREHRLTLRAAELANAVAALNCASLPSIDPSLAKRLALEQHISLSAAKSLLERCLPVAMVGGENDFTMDGLFDFASHVAVLESFERLEPAGRLS